MKYLHNRYLFSVLNFFFLEYFLSDAMFSKSSYTSVCVTQAWQLSGPLIMQSFPIDAGIRHIKVKRIYGSTGVLSYFDLNYNFRFMVNWFCVWLKTKRPLLMESPIYHFMLRTVMFIRCFSLYSSFFVSYDFVLMLDTVSSHWLTSFKIFSISSSLVFEISAVAQLLSFLNSLSYYWYVLVLL